MEKTPNVGQVTDIIEEIAPKNLALPGDPVGLQYGDPDRPVKRLMISLDAAEETLRQAAGFRADLLVTHHPLFYEPLVPGNLSGAGGRALELAVRECVAVYSAHTNLDAAQCGINASLADLLNLQDREFLQKSVPELFKLAAFVPRGHLDAVRSAVFKAGAGTVGDYTYCSFSVEGTGTFLPGERARPAVGRKGVHQEALESRLEVVVPSENVEAVLGAVRKAHPYEEPALDVYPLASGPAMAGLGISGALPKCMTVGEIAARVGRSLGSGTFRLVGKKGARIKRAAVCAGSGSSLLDAAAASGARLYITGDVKYHEARKAEEAGLHVLDVGHFAPEKYGIVQFGRQLTEMLNIRGYGVEIAHAKERDPFTPVCLHKAGKGEDKNQGGRG